MEFGHSQHRTSQLESEEREQPDEKSRHCGIKQQNK
jgi:hypothetical protein